MDKNKIISAVVLFCVIFFAFAPILSCAGGGEGGSGQNESLDAAEAEKPPEGTASQTAAEDLFDPKLPEADFGGYEFRILNLNQEAMWWSIVDLDIDIDSINAVSTALNDPVVNEVIYTRNRNIEEKYNFNIKETQVSDAQLNSTVKNSVNSGLDDYDLVAPSTNSAPSLAVSAYLFDLNKVPCLNFSNPWWNNSVSRYFSMNERLFFTCSDFTLSDKDNAAIMMYNKKLAEDLGIEGAEPLYGIVGEGKWTFDKFTELCRAAPADLNGDGEIKGADDRFGLSCCSWLYTYLLAGFGETVIKKNDSDLPYIAAKTERFSAAYGAMVEFLFQRDIVVREYTDTPDIKTEEMFVNDKALFCAQVLSCVRLYKNMGSDFALLPFPKFDLAQDKYYTPALWSGCLAIPATNRDLDKTGFILEALSAESRKIVIPAYYEISIGTKYLRDEISVRMLDIILENRIYDINQSMYNWGGFYSAFDSAAAKGDSNFVSLLEKYEVKIEAAMQKTIDAFAGVE